MVILAIILGLIAGSFLTAFVDRLRDGRNFVSGRSACDRCHQRLGVLDLVPLFSWLFLRGRCRHCQRPVSWYYPVVELVSGISFGVFYLFWPYSFSGWEWALFIGWLPVLVALLALAIYDLRWWILPNKIIYPLCAWAMLLLGLRFLEQMTPGVFLDAFLSLLAGGGLFFLVFHLSPKHIGGGDVKLGAALGLLLVDWRLALMMIFGSAVIGVAVLLILLLIGRGRKMTLNSKLPYGPFLILAAWLVFSFGEDLLGWYQSFAAGG